LFRQASNFYIQKRHGDAARVCRESLTLRPHHAETLHLLGVLSYRNEEYAVAARLLRRATALNRGIAPYHSNLGGALQAMGKLDEAAVRYKRAVALQPLFAEAHFNLGNLLRMQGRQGAAIEAYGRAIAVEPNLHEAHTNLGNILQAIGEWTGANACYEKALSIQPNSAEAHSNLGNLRRAEGRLDEAIEQYEYALNCDPNFADACTNLGTVLSQHGKLEEAIALHERALSLRPDFAEAHHNLGCALQAKGLTEAALERYSRAIELKPEYANAHFGRALIHLLQGRFEEGWNAYEWRWQSDQHSTRWRDAEQPVWTGERLTTGQLLLWGEQGVGDEILFAGLVPAAVGTGNECVLECDPRLVPLFDRSFPYVKVVAAHSADRSEIAAHLPSGSLPALFRRTDASFHSTTSAYLCADPIQIGHFREEYRDRRHVVGIAWHTSNAKSSYRRSIDLSLLALLFTRTDVRWISLQYGDHEAIEQETSAAGAPMLVDRSVDQLVNIDNFAAQVSAMDLVITIDNSTAHLAGALGVPVWVLLPFASDWRWQQERDDCPWYPSMRLFRQPCLGDWKSVVKHVDQQLDIVEHTAVPRALHPPEERLVQQRWSLASTGTSQ
jgi:tetratricopeptide (TPR) repeat protein